jgi:CRP-like cAMP-binding protein
MEKYAKELSKSPLFKDISLEDILNILEKIPYEINTYNKDEIIAIEGDDCHALGIILKGKIEIQKIFPSGQIMTINNFKEGNIFGESLVFLDKHTYPATITAMEYSEIMYIEKSNIIKLSVLDTRVLINFVSILSNRILMLNNRISNLSQDSIRKKVANYLLFEYENQKNLFIELPFSRKKMAELLNIPRPSLSRELTNMRDEEIIDFDKNIIKIINLESLESSLLE